MLGVRWQKLIKKQPTTAQRSAATQTRGPADTVSGGPLGRRRCPTAGQHPHPHLQAISNGARRSSEDGPFSTELSLPGPPLLSAGAGGGPGSVGGRVGPGLTLCPSGWWAGQVGHLQGHCMVDPAVPPAQGSAHACPACPGLAGGSLAHRVGSPWGESGRPGTWAPPPLGTRVPGTGQGRVACTRFSHCTQGCRAPRPRVGTAAAGVARQRQGRPDVVRSRSRPPCARHACDVTSGAPASPPASKRVERCAGGSTRPLCLADRAHGGGLAQSSPTLPISYLQTLTCPWPLPPRVPHSLASESGDRRPRPHRSVGGGGLADRLPWPFSLVLGGHSSRDGA